MAKEEARRELDHLEGARGDGDRKRVRQPLDALVEELESVGRQSALSHCAERRVDAASVHPLAHLDSARQLELAVHHSDRVAAGVAPEEYGVCRKGRHLGVGREVLHRPGRLVVEEHAFRAVGTVLKDEHKALQKVMVERARMGKYHRTRPERLGGPRERPELARGGRRPQPVHPILREEACHWRRAPPCRTICAVFLTTEREATPEARSFSGGWHGETVHSGEEGDGDESSEAHARIRRPRSHHAYCTCTSSAKLRCGVWGKRMHTRGRGGRGGEGIL